MYGRWSSYTLLFVICNLVFYMIFFGAKEIQISISKESTDLSPTDYYWIDFVALIIADMRDQRYKLLNNADIIRSLQSRDFLDK